MKRLELLVGFSLLLIVCGMVRGQDALTMPRVLDDRLMLQLVAQAPDIVTPIGLTFDHRGRLLVIESHTHFPEDDYPGPQFDRIRIVDDANNDGRADGFRTFLEGTEKTMSVERGPEDWIYVATRMQVFRARDRDGDGAADQREVIATLETEGDYPHNGLCGLCFDGLGNLYFGLGENLGESYTLVGADGTEFNGGGEGGNIYRCQTDGRGLQLVATGFWNPFGICTDSVGRLFTVGNDPDASPPCRLLQVVEGGDYGFQFRYGRSGKHPLQAWDGELPGTLPMAAATSEAPSAVLLWHGQLYGSSWGEYRIERFRLKPNGASVSADRDVVVQGDHQFRPVDIAIAPDGSLYFTDWVDQSYNVHRRGRVWRLSWKGRPEDEHVPPLSEDERRAERATQNTDWEALKSVDPYLHHAAMMGLKNSPHLTLAKLDSLSNPRQRLGVLEAARRSDLSVQNRDQLIERALRDGDAAVQLYAVRWIADEQLNDFRQMLDPLLEQRNATVSLLRGVLAASDWLDHGKVNTEAVAGEATLLRALEDKSRPSLQAMALKTLPAGHQALTNELLRRIVQDGDLQARVRIEAGRSLAITQNPNADSARWTVTRDATIPPEIQAIVLAGVDPNQDAAETRLQKLAETSGDLLREEALRLLSHAAQPTSDAPSASIDEIQTELLDTDQTGDADAGWRVFFGRSAARCANCHRYDGRGADVGPDLTSIGKRVDRTRLVQSILHPSQEIGPRYVPWIIELVDGRVFSGLSLGVSNDSENILTSDGEQISIPREQIEKRELASQSIMPNGIHQQFSVQELRDLLSLLTE